MMKKITLFGLALFLGASFTAQDENNMVLNPSFEGANKLKKLGQIKYAENWTSATGVKADLYSTDKEGLPCSAPVNANGKEYPLDGKAYAGIVMYSYNNKSPRSYIQTKLEQPLTKGMQYCVKFHVSLSDLSKYACNNFGAHFGKDPMEIEGKQDIIFTKDKEKKQVAVPTDNKKYLGRYNWEPVCANFTATGKEEYLTIGNFFNNKETGYEKLKPLQNYKGTQIPMAYYYIDQVEVFLLDDPADCECNNEGTEVETSVVYHKEITSADGFDIEEQVKFATIYFDVSSAKLEANMKKDLEVLAGALKANPEFKLTLHGHLDAVEGNTLRQNPDDIKVSGLDERRIEAVKAFLMELGVEEGRLSTEVHGDKDQKSIGDTSLDHAKNRRVEFALEK